MNYDRFLTRVFDKQEKKMLYPGDTYYHDESSLSHFITIDHCKIIRAYTKDGYDTVGFHFFGDRFVPMQCTGLRDKNKKLIYSGDVIDCLGNNCKRTVALSDGCWVVKCTQGGYFEDRDYELSLWDSLDSKNDEIIGNIHENEGA